VKEYLLFDLDGTLTDPKVGITTCVQYALKEFGIEEPDLDKLEPFIGPPLKESFMTYYNFSEEEAERAIEKYRERFRDIGIFENEVYAGIPQMLRSLQSCGLYLAVASSKPTEFVERILEHFELRKYFKVVVGSEMDGSRVEKKDVMMEALQQLFAYKPIQYSKVLMIGDRKFDIEGAKQIGVESVGVTFGYGSMEELKEAHADYIVRSVEELQTLLMREGEALKQSREQKQQTQAGERKSFFAVIKPVLLQMLLFIMAKSAASFFLVFMVNPLENSFTGSLGDLFFLRDENGAVVSLTGNLTAIFNGIAHLAGFMMIRKVATDAIQTTKQEEKLKHLKKESIKSMILFGAVTVFGMIGLNIFFELALATNYRETFSQLPEAMRTNMIIGSISVIAVALAEEVVFRGMVHNVVRRPYPMKRAIIMSSLIYALYHMNTQVPFYSIAVGILTAYAYEYFGDFKAPLLIHMAVNVITFLMSSTVLVNAPFISWPVCAVCLATAAFCVNQIKKEKDN